jgi:hypothetical protein
MPYSNQKATRTKAEQPHLWIILEQWKFGHIYNILGQIKNGIGWKPLCTFYKVLGQKYKFFGGVKF